MNYQLFNLFLVRLTGVPFDALEGLSTPETAQLARNILALEGRARSHGVALLAAAKAAAQGESNDKLTRKIEGLRPTGLSLGAVGDDYETARAAWQAATDALGATLERELTASRHNLREQSAAHLPGFTVFTAELGDPELFSEERLKGPLPALNSKERQRDRTYLMYLQRVAAKNDTISAWGPTGWGRIERDGAAMTLDPVPGLAGRDVYLEKWVVNAVAGGIGRDPEARAELTPRLHPFGRLEGARFLRVDTGESIELDPEQAALAARVDGVHPAHALGAPAPLEALLAKGVILWEQEQVVLVAHRLEVIRGDVARWRDGPTRTRWLATVDALLDVQRSFAATADPEARKQLMSRGADLARELGAQAKDTSRTALYRGASPLSEDCVRDVRATIGKDVVRVIEEDAAPWIDLWRDSYSHLAHQLAAKLKPLLDETPKVGGKTLLPSFIKHCAERGYPIQANGMLELATPAVDDIRRVFDEMLLGKDPNAEEWTLTAQDCHVVREKLGVKPIEEFTLPAVDFMINARSVEAVNRGDFQVVVGELHAPIVTLQHCFSWANPDPALFAQGLGESMGKDAKMFHYGNVRVQATCHTSVDFHRSMPGRFSLASLERGLPEWPSVPASDIEVVAEDGDIVARGPDGNKLGSLVRDWFVVWIPFHPFVFYRAPNMPRLKVGRCVVQRRTWLIERHELDEGRFEGTDAKLVVTVERLRAARGLPRWVFVRPVPTFFSKTLTGKDKDHKPVCVDLESYMGIEVLASWARKYPLLEVTEMLPDPDHLCWREKTGKYTFELRALVVPS